MQQKHDGIEVLERSGLPLPDVVHDRVVDPADQVPAGSRRRARAGAPRYPASTFATRRERNTHDGSTARTLAREHRPVDIRTPRSIEPKLVRKRPRRFEGFDEKTLALYSRELPMRLIAEIVGSSRSGARSTSRLVSCAKSPPGPTISSSVHAPSNSLIHHLIQKLTSDLIRHALKASQEGTPLGVETLARSKDFPRTHRMNVSFVQALRVS